MVTLYIDSSHFLTLGLLNEKFEWIDYCEYREKKTSSILHVELLDLLTRNQLTTDSLTQVIEAAGPGSYTGMRVAEGLCQILEWQGRVCRSFYHFEVPKLCGHTQGVWIAKAFKGEIFCYHFNDNHEEAQFIKEAELESFRQQSQAQGRPVFGHYRDDIEGLDFLSSYLIYESPTEVLGAVWKRGERKGPYYFRPLELEFKVSR